MKYLIAIFFLCGLSSSMMAQITKLEEIIIYPDKYKYFYEVVDKDTDSSVYELQRAIAQFDVTQEEYYDDEYSTYRVSFYIPEGYAVAVYDRDGSLLRTIERFKNIKLPLAVKTAVLKRFPQWTVEKDIYRVKFSQKEGEATKVYKLRLTNGDKSVKVKTDEYGVFL